MRFRVFSLFIFFGVWMANVAWPIEKQRIGVAGFRDLSAEPDEVVGIILQNSLITELSRDQRFSVTFVSNAIESLSQAQKEAIKYSVDVIVYGTYRREGKHIVILVQIYDALENEIRMSRLYQGEYSRNIFDTIDTIVSTVGESIRQLLPPLLTEEDIARAAAKRKALEKESAKKPLYWEARGGVEGLTRYSDTLERISWDNGDTFETQYTTTTVSFIMPLFVRIGWVGVTGLYSFPGIGFFQSRVVNTNNYAKEISGYGVADPLSGMGVNFFFGPIFSHEIKVGFSGLIISPYGMDFFLQAGILTKRWEIETGVGLIDIIRKNVDPNFEGYGFDFNIKGVYFVSKNIGLQGSFNFFYQENNSTSRVVNDANRLHKNNVVFISFGVIFRSMAW